MLNGRAARSNRPSPVIPISGSSGPSSAMTTQLSNLDVPLQFVRFIEVKQLIRGEWEIDEFEVFGEGFASAAAYTSKAFDEGRPAIFGSIMWTKQTIGEPTKVSATVSTRSGGTPDPGDSLEWSGWVASLSGRGPHADRITCTPASTGSFAFCSRAATSFRPRRSIRSPWRSRQRWPMPWWGRCGPKTP